MHDNANRELTLDYLRKHALFNGLNEDQLIKVLALGREQEFKANATVIKEGDQGNDFYLLLSGTLEVVKEVPIRGGKAPECIARLEQGDTFGEVAIIDHEPRSASVIAKTDTLAICFNSNQLDKLRSSDPETFAIIILNMAKQVTKKLRAADTHFAISLFADHN